MSYSKKIERYTSAIDSITTTTLSYDPLVLLRFYRVKMQLEDVLFPYIEDGIIYNTFNEYSRIKKRIEKKSPHDLFLDIIMKECPTSVFTAYDYTLNLSMASRYQRALINKKDIRRFNKYIRELDSFIESKKR